MAARIFPAIVWRSKDGTYPLLIHRIVAAQDRCFKFKRVKEVKNSTEHYYICQNCVDVKKSNSILSKRMISTIRVSGDYLHFMSDPENLSHLCIEHDGTLDFLKGEVEQHRRLVLRNILI